MPDPGPSGAVVGVLLSTNLAYINDDEVHRVYLHSSQLTSFFSIRYVLHTTWPRAVIFWLCQSLNARLSGVCYRITFLHR